MEGVDTRLVSQWGSALFEELKTVITAPKKSSKKSGAQTTPIESKENDNDYTKRLKKLSLDEEQDCAKVTEARITQTMFHPHAEKILLIAGDKMGCLGLWDVNFGKISSGNLDPLTTNPEGVYKYRPHIANITSLNCWTSSANKIYSTSYDGTVRCLDIHSEQFDNTYVVEGELFESEAMIHDAAYLRDGSTLLLGPQIMSSFPII